MVLLIIVQSWRGSVYDKKRSVDQLANFGCGHKVRGVESHMPSPATRRVARLLGNGNKRTD
jgi:hypothetical protein